MSRTSINERLQAILNELNEITEGCREDMHEPDEQGVTAVTAGYLLDNAMGNNPIHNCGELTIGIQRETWDGGTETVWVNLADLIALARKAELT